MDCDELIDNLLSAQGANDRAPGVADAIPVQDHESPKERAQALQNTVKGLLLWMGEAKLNKT